ncbi:MAG: DUF2158 domain-containing protein [Bosea sp.]|jgi:uncharacterized protein YodC (DUF2158 family)|nr:DUF2158 domain-containing protein [Bosea sp. (in: a-proteobacteria)]
MTFSEGDIVSVKSGGPALTVISVLGEHVTCLYFSDELGEFREAVIPAFALESVEDGAMEEDEDEEEEEEDEEEDDARGRKPAGGSRGKAA